MSYDWTWDGRVSPDYDSRSTLAPLDVDALEYLYGSPSFSELVWTTSWNDTSETFYLTGNTGNDVLIGWESDSVLVAGGGTDTLQAWGGDDTLNGGSGADYMVGGDGDDTYYVDNAGDQVIENAGGGWDELVSSISLAVRARSAEVEGLSLTGSAHLNGIGNGLNNILQGNAGNNVLNGAWGHDTLIGGAGNDTFRDEAGADHMSGGTGNDTYFVDNVGDRVVETAGQGADHVHASISFALRAHSGHIETLSLTGDENLNGIGNGLNNTLHGNAGDNLLNGAWGHDTLIGGAGDDTFRDEAGADHMIGGAGDDRFFVDNVGDRVFENAGQGADHVSSAISFALRAHSAHVEALTLSGSANLNAIGNGLANTLQGNAGDNILNGAWGDDTLIGGAGNDLFRDDAGNDRMTGGSGADIFIFRDGSGTDVITDFDHAQAGEYLDLRGASEITGFADLTNNHLLQSGDDAVISDGLGSSLTLLGVAIGDLTSDDFLF